MRMAAVIILNLRCHSARDMGGLYAASMMRDKAPARAGASLCVSSTVTVQPAQPATPEPEEEKPKEKPKDPLAALPPSKMILDSWKRLYSNTPAAKFQEICVNGLWNGATIPGSPTQEVSIIHAHPVNAVCFIRIKCDEAGLSTPAVLSGLYMRV